MGMRRNEALTKTEFQNGSWSSRDYRARSIYRARSGINIPGKKDLQEVDILI